MKMAKQAKSKPIPKVSSKISSNGKELEPDRPMTQKQREEYMREKNSQLRKNGKLPSTYNNASSSENSSNSKTKSGSGSGTSSSKPETHITSAASTSTANSNKLSPVGPCKENNFKQPCQKKNKPVIGKKHACFFVKLILVLDFLLSVKSISRYLEVPDRLIIFSFVSYRKFRASISSCSCQQK